MRIFISYRRHSSSDITARIYDRLGARFGASHVFHDVSNVEIGEDFKARLMGELARADAVVAVIGPDWLKGGLLLDEDYVRLEIQTALQWGIPIVPVLVTQAHMPPPSSLPEPLSRLSRMSATEVRSGRDFDSDTHLLIKALEAVPPRPGRRRRPNFAVLLTSGLAAAALATGAIAWSRSHSVSRPWSQATRVVNDKLSSASQPVLGMSARTTVLMWREPQALRAQVRDDEQGTWGPAVDISKSHAVSAFRLGVDVQGGAVAIWTDHNQEPEPGVWASASADGRHWADSQRLYSKGWIGDVELHVSRTGWARAVWAVTADSNGDRVVLWTAERPPGARWTGPIRVEPEHGRFWPYPLCIALLVDERGHATIWAPQRSARENNRGGLYAIDVMGTNIAPARAVDERGDSAGRLCAVLAINASGAAVAIWPGDYSEARGLWASRFVLGGALGAAEQIVATEGSSPSVAIDASARITTAWNHFAGDNTLAVVSRSEASGQWSRPEPLDQSPSYATDQNMHAPLPIIAVDGRGRVHAAWTKTTPTFQHQLFARSFEPSGGWGPEARISLFDSLDFSRPSLAASVDRAAMAFVHTRGSDGDEGTEEYRLNAWKVYMASYSGTQR